MGLAEKRVQKNYIDNYFGDIEQKIQAAAKFELPVEVDWDSIFFHKETNLDNIEDSLSKTYFMPLIDALESITQDDMGAEALRENLKKVSIKNVGDNADGYQWCSFQEGTVSLNHMPTVNVNNQSDRLQSLTRLLEDSL